MIPTEIQKLNYINTHFHQYFDIDLNLDFETTDFVNLVVPVENFFAESDKETEEGSYYTHDIEIRNNLNVDNVFQRYSDTDIIKETGCYCDKVIDGDTFVVRVPKESENKNVIYENQTIRLVGVDTPEKRQKGALDSKRLLQKLCYTDDYYKKMVLHSANIYEKEFFEEENGSDNSIPPKTSVEIKLRMDNKDILSGIENDKNLRFSFVVGDRDEDGTKGKKNKDEISNQRWKLIRDETNNTIKFEDIINGKEETGSDSYKIYNHEYPNFYMSIRTGTIPNSANETFITLHNKSNKKISGTFYIDYNVTNNKKIYLNYDNKKLKDKYDRNLCVLISSNKNINEVMLKEEVGRVMYIPPSEFNPHNWEKKRTRKGDLREFSAYLNPNLSNVVFTPAPSEDEECTTTYRYEIYKGVIYIKLNPYSKKVRMHILPKRYECTNKVLFFTDDMTERLCALDNEEDPKITSNYKFYEKRSNINAYFQQNGEDRDRTTIPENKKGHDPDDWETNSEPNTFCEFEYDISDLTKSYQNVQICAGYRYNNTSPYYAIHYTGIKNKTSPHPSDRWSLIDANVDNVKVNGEENIDTEDEVAKKGIITKTIWDNNGSLDNLEDDEIRFPSHRSIIEDVTGNDAVKYPNEGEYSEVNHVSDVNILHRKILKYMNDDLYIEEDYKKKGNTAEGIYEYEDWEEEF